MKHVIVGIDPGTTAAYAVLDVSGKVVVVDSGKDLDLNKLIEQITKHGKPLVIGCDKQKTPSLIELFSAKFNAITISPPQDLLSKEKREITKGHAFNNTHEMDALASALFAFKKHRSILQKIKRKLTAEDKNDLQTPVIELVIKHNLSIKAAISLLEQPTEPTAVIVNNVIEEKNLNKDDYLTLYNELVRHQRANKLLQQSVKETSEQLRKVEKQIDVLTYRLKKEPELKAKKLLSQRDRTVSQVKTQLEKAEQKIKLLEHNLSLLPTLVAHVQPAVIVKKIKTLGWSDTIQQVNKGDVLLVDNPNIFSEKALYSIQSKVTYILCKKAVSKKIENAFPFVFLDANAFMIKDIGTHALVNQESLEKAMNKRESMKKIIFDYQQSRV